MKINKRKKKPKSKTKPKVKVLVTIAVLFSVIICLVKYYDSSVMPTVKKTMEHYGVTAATKIIDKAVKDTISSSGILSEDLFSKTINDDGKLTSLSADTVLINNICSNVSEGVSKQMLELENEDVYLPAGILSGFEFLSAKGPKIFRIEFRPLGECFVDYDTSFKSEGINQINYQIWLNIKTNITIVNPLTNLNIAVTRKVPVVNAYINGDVPEAMPYPYFNSVPRN